MGKSARLAIRIKTFGGGECRWLEFLQSAAQIARRLCWHLGQGSGVAVLPKARLISVRNDNAETANTLARYSPALILLPITIIRPLYAHALF